MACDEREASPTPDPVATPENEYDDLGFYRCEKCGATVGLINDVEAPTCGGTVHVAGRTIRLHEPTAMDDV